MLKQILLSLAVILGLVGCKTIDHTVSRVTGESEESAAPATSISLTRCSSAIARVNINSSTAFVGLRNHAQLADNLNSRLVEDVFRKSNCFVLVRAKEEYGIKMRVVPRKETYEGAGAAIGSTTALLAAPFTVGASLFGFAAGGVAGKSLAQMDVDVGVEVVRQADGHYTKIAHKSNSDDFYYSEFLFSGGSDAEWERSEDGKRILAAVIPAVNQTIAWIRKDKGVSVRHAHSTRPDTVLGIQHMLKGYGHEIAVDGIYGPQTKQAIVAYQEEHGLDPNGRATPDLLEHMKKRSP